MKNVLFIFIAIVLVVGCQKNIDLEKPIVKEQVLSTFFENRLGSIEHIAINSVGAFFSSEMGLNGGIFCIRDSILTYVNGAMSIPVSDMKSDIHNLIWFSSYSKPYSGLYSIDSNLNVTRHLNFSISDIEINSHGEVFFLRTNCDITNIKKIYTLIGNDGYQVIDYSKMLDSYMTEFAIDNEDNFWAVTDSNTVYYLNKDTILKKIDYKSYMKDTQTPYFHTATRIIVNNQQIWLMLNRKDFYHFDGTEWSLKLLIDSNGSEERNTLQDPIIYKDHLLFPLCNDLYKIDVKTGTWISILKEPDNYYSYYSAVQQDNDSVCWVAEGINHGGNIVRLIRINQND